MNNKYPKLFLEINDSEYIFVIGNKNEDNKFEIIHESIVKIHGIENSKITDFDLVFKFIGISKTKWFSNFKRKYYIYFEFNKIKYR